MMRSRPPDILAQMERHGQSDPPLRGALYRLRQRGATTERPSVHFIDRAWADAPADAAGRDLLPDLVVRWDTHSAAATHRLVSHALPSFAFDGPGQLPSGRAGNHADRAWFIARGPSVAKGTAISTPHIVDLLPTALQHLGECVPPHLEGTPIDLSRAG